MRQSLNPPAEAGWWRQGDMAERSKELLRLEHQEIPLSSLESALLVCNKRDSTTQTKKLPLDATPITAPVPRSQLLGKLKDFLGVMSEENKQLELDAKDLMLGVADLHAPEAVAAAESAISQCQPVVPLAADGSDMDSDKSSTDDDNGDDEGSDDEHDDRKENGGKKSSSIVKRSISGKNNIPDRQKGNQLSKKTSENS